MTNALLKQDLRTLIHSHLFCVDNLSDAEIRERLTRDGNPVGYEGQHILGYHWFAYPNAAEGLYSKVLAACQHVRRSRCRDWRGDLSGVYQARQAFGNAPSRQ